LIGFDGELKPRILHRVAPPFCDLLPEPTLRGVAIARLFSSEGAAAFLAQFNYAAEDAAVAGRL
jgi:hypothetical protein